MKKIMIFAVFLMLLSACTGFISTPLPTIADTTPVPKETPPKFGTPTTPKPSPTPKPSTTPTPTPAPSDDEQIDDSTQSLLECALVGFWHAAPGIPAGYTQRYYFLINHKFIWQSSTMTAERILDKTGTWEIRDGALILSIESNWELVGGEVVQEPYGESIEGATNKTNYYDPPEIVTYSNFTIQIDEIKGAQYPYYIELGDETYWKFDVFDDLGNTLNGRGLGIWMPTKYPGE